MDNGSDERDGGGWKEGKVWATGSVAEMEVLVTCGTRTGGTAPRWRVAAAEGWLLDEGTRDRRVPVRVVVREGRVEDGGWDCTGTLESVVSVTVCEETTSIAAFVAVNRDVFRWDGTGSMPSPAG